MLPTPSRALSIFLCLCACLAAGCIERDAGDRTRLRVWTMWGGDEADAFQEVVDAYNAVQDDVRLENLAAVDDPRIIRAIVADDPPDLFTLRDPGYLGSLAANDALLPLDERFNASGLREGDFAPGAMSQCRFRGRLYGMLFLMDCWGLIWNPDAFREAGLPPERAPETLEDLLRYAERLTQTDAQGRVIRLGLTPPDPLVLYGAFGGEFVDETGNTPTAASPANVAALTWYRRLIEAQGGAEEVNRFTGGFGQEMGINNPFLLGKTAMLINGQWNPYWFQRYGPRIPFRAGPVPYPAGRPDLRRPTWLGGNLFCIPRNARHADEAWKFLVWAQGEQAQLLFAEHMHGIPNLQRARAARQLREVTGEEDAWKRGYACFLDAASSPNARHFPVTPVSGLYQYELITAADFVRFGTRTPEEALAAVQTRVAREMRAWQ